MCLTPQFENQNPRGDPPFSYENDPTLLPGVGLGTHLEPVQEKRIFGLVPLHPLWERNFVTSVANHFFSDWGGHVFERTHASCEEFLFAAFLLDEFSSNENDWISDCKDVELAAFELTGFCVRFSDGDAQITQRNSSADVLLDQHLIGIVVFEF